MSLSLKNPSIVILFFLSLFNLVSCVPGTGPISIDTLNLHASRGLGKQETLVINILNLDLKKTLESKDLDEMYLVYMQEDKVLSQLSMESYMFSGNEQTLNLELTEKIKQAEKVQICLVSAGLQPGQKLEIIDKWQCENWWIKDILNLSKSGQNFQLEDRRTDLPSLSLLLRPLGHSL